jgi:hypothetical protein
VIDGPTALRAGDRVELGSSVIEVRGVAAVTAAPVAAAAAIARATAAIPTAVAPPAR